VIGIRLEDGRDLARATSPPHVPVLLSNHRVVTEESMGWGYQPDCRPCVMPYANDRFLYERKVWATNLHRRVAIRVQGVWRTRLSRAAETYVAYTEPVILLGLSPQSDRFVPITTLTPPEDFAKLGNRRLLAVKRSFERDWLQSTEKIDDLILEARHQHYPMCERQDSKPRGYLRELMEAWPRDRDESDKRRIIPGVPGKRLLAKMLNPEIH